MSNVTYTDKVAGNQVTAADMNEIKAAVNSKLDQYRTVVEVTASKNLLSSDSGSLQYVTAPASITVRTNAIHATPLGTQVDYVQVGTGVVTFVAGDGVTILSKNGALSTAAEGDSASLIKLFSNTWMLIIGG